MISNVKSFAPLVGQFGDIVSKQSFNSLVNDMKDNINEVYKLLEVFKQHTESINQNISSLKAPGSVVNEKNEEKKEMKKVEGKTERKRDFKLVMELEDECPKKSNGKTVEILDIDEIGEEKKGSKEKQSMIDMLFKLLSYFKTSFGDYFSPNEDLEETVNNSTSQKNAPKQEGKNFGMNDISMEVIFRICAISAFGITLFQSVNKNQQNPFVRIFVSLLEEYIITLLTNPK